MEDILDELNSLGTLLDVEQKEYRKFTDIKCKYFGLYFVATWCSACVRINSRLTEAIKMVGPELKVITCRLDDDPSDFAYHSLRFANSSSFLFQNLTSSLRVSTIPSLLIFDSYGRLISRDGVNDILKQRADVINFWGNKLSNL